MQVNYENCENMKSNILNRYAYIVLDSSKFLIHVIILIFHNVIWEENMMLYQIAK
jgi:hypothetical protein